MTEPPIFTVTEELLRWRSAPTEALATTRLDAPVTARVATVLARVEVSPVTPFAIGLLLAGASFIAGWYARGLFGVVWDNRGWAALVVLAVIGAPCAVAYCNRIAERRP